METIMTKIIHHTRTFVPTVRGIVSLHRAASHRLVFLGGLALIAGAVSGCSASTQEPKNIAAGSRCSTLDEGATAMVYERGSITGAKPIQERVFKARAIQPEMTFGATMYVTAEEGMTAPYLHRVMSCHAASQNAVHSNDPLRPASGEITQIGVRGVHGAFAVDVRSDDPEVGKEIWQRAEAMTRTAGSVDVKQVAKANEGVQNF